MKRARRGFSFNDVLAILTVAGIGLMLWMAAVPRAREAGRRAQCVSNLRQIGAALQPYHATHGSNPLGVTASFNPMSQGEGQGPGSPAVPTRVSGVPTEWSGWSPLAQMLPYLEQTSLYNAINFDLDPMVNGQEPMHTTVTRATVDRFLCPADPYAGRPSINSYYASIGTNAQSQAHQTTGIFGYQQLCRARDVTDGQSNTVAFAEGLSGWK